MNDPTAKYLSDASIPDVVTLGSDDLIPVSQPNAPNQLKRFKPGVIATFLSNLFQPLSSRLSSFSSLAVPTSPKSLVVNASGNLELADKADLINGQIPAAQLRGSTISYDDSSSQISLLDAKGDITSFNLPAIKNEKVAADAAISWTKIDKSNAKAEDVGAASAIHTQNWTTITETPTTLSGYGITDGQLANSRLTEISTVDPTLGNVVIGNGTQLVGRGLAISDIGNLQSALDQKANLNTLSTSVVTEGNNLYFTTERVRSAVNAGSGIIYNALTGSISVDVSYINELIQNYVGNAPVSTYKLSIESGFTLSLEGGFELLLG